ncbi:N-acetyltransferase [Leifsonia shinshuensis]|uniref:N-acetyltransferase n=1 Tax=Leifsonia shinshuensis TaxID=150026 RepID=UPI001F510C82|nr:N-acetyltransferase [Leifsonia shinshuensis]
MSFRDPVEPVPVGLGGDRFLLRPIRADDAADDHAAVMETRELLRLWEQSEWPADDFTVEANRADLVGLQQRHAEHRAFTFTVRDPDDTLCLGCVYLFPTSATFLAKSAVTPVGNDAWEDVDVVSYFWVRQSQLEAGLDRALLDTLRSWLRDDWGFERVVFVTNEQFAQQVGLLEATDLTLRFELREPGKPGMYLVFG